MGSIPNRLHGANNKAVRNGGKANTRRSSRQGITGHWNLETEEGVFTLGVAKGWKVLKDGCLH